MRRKLAEKNFSVDQINQVVKKLKQANLIQDSSFALAWVENRNNSHPRSQRLMRHELLRKGVNEAHIENALKTSSTDLELARRAAETYARRLTGNDHEAFRKRLSGFLARRGFSYDVIVPLIAELWKQQEATTNINDNEEVKTWEKMKPE